MSENVCRHFMKKKNPAVWIRDNITQTRTGNCCTGSENSSYKQIAAVDIKGESWSRREDECAHRVKWSPAPPQLFFFYSPPAVTRACTAFRPPLLFSSLAWPQLALPKARQEAFQGPSRGQRCSHQGRGAEQHTLASCPWQCFSSALLTCQENKWSLFTSQAVHRIGVPQRPANICTVSSSPAEAQRNSAPLPSV